MAAAGVRAFVLGPPENADLIADEDPHEGEAFPPRATPFSLRGCLSEAADERAHPSAATTSCPRVRIRPARTGDAVLRRAATARTAKGEDVTAIEVPADATWRRIDDEWLYSAETLALKLNTGINNTSLVRRVRASDIKKGPLLRRRRPARQLGRRGKT